MIEVVSGQSLYQFEKTRLLDPLGMKDTSYYVPEPARQPRIAEPLASDRSFGVGAEFNDPRVVRKYESGGGGLVSTANDYARFLQMLLNGGSLDGKRYLGPRTIALMTADHSNAGAGIVPGPLYLPGPGYGFGLGFAVRRNDGEAPYPSAGGEYNWGGAGGTYVGRPEERDVRRAHAAVAKVQNTLQNIDPGHDLCGGDQVASDSQALGAWRKIGTPFHEAMKNSSSTVIPISAVGRARPVVAVPEIAVPATGLLLDRLGRPMTDLRISVTDRCNFRCSYCMPKDVFDKDYKYLPHSALLSFEEMTRLARLFAAHGVRKIRLTGGEPLLRKNIEGLIEQLAEIRTPAGEPLALTLTTNGSLLARKAGALKAAGLQRVTVSLDSLDDAVFRHMNDVDFPVADVLAGIDAAIAAGLGPIKVNMVVKRGANDQEILPMARYFRTHHGGKVVLRFIEYMDVGATNGWRMDEVLPSADDHRAHPCRISAGAARSRHARRNRPALGLCRRHRRNRRDQQRHPGLLPRLQPRAPVDRRQALPLPLRQRRPRPAPTAARHRQRRRHLLGHRPHLAGPRRPLLRAARPARSGRRQRRCRRQAPRRVEMSYIGG